ncbi:leucine-rich repeat-containing protein 46 [Mantella aurantiaca]
MAGGKKKDIDPILTAIVRRNVSSSLHGEEARASALHCLQIVRLDREGITKLRNLEAVNRARSLYLQENQIKKIENLEVLTNLQFLSLSGNRIEEIQNLRCLQNLQFLDLSNNLIQTVNVGELPQNLLILDMSGNPCTKTKGYRQQVIESLPLLQELDGVSVRVPNNQKSVHEYEEDGSDSDDISLLPEESDSLLSLAQDMLQRSHQRRKRALREHEDHLAELNDGQCLVSSQKFCTAVLPSISQDNIDLQDQAYFQTKKHNATKSNKDYQAASLLEKNPKDPYKVGKAVFRNHTVSSPTQSSAGVSTEKKSSTRATIMSKTTPSSNIQTKLQQTSKQSAEISRGTASCTLKERQTTKKIIRTIPEKTTASSRSTMSAPNQRQTMSAPNQRQAISSKKS